MNRPILTNNEITDDKPSKQLFHKQVATKLTLLNYLIGHTELLKLKHLKMNSSEHKTKETATKVPH